jgi:hypothetical protein
LRPPCSSPDSSASPILPAPNTAMVVMRQACHARTTAIPQVPTRVPRSERECPTFASRVSYVQDP